MTQADIQVDSLSMFAECLLGPRHLFKAMLAFQWEERMNHNGQGNAHW